MSASSDGLLPWGNTYPPALARWKGLKGYCFMNEGNHGDQLIGMGTQHVLKQLNINITKAPEDAEVIFLNGGGALAEGFYQNAYDQLLELADRFPDTPLVILPSSIFVSEGKGKFLEELRERKSAVHIFLREPQSLERLSQLELPPCIELHLDHDMAFYLRNSEFIAQCSKAAKNEHLLIVERFDLDQSTHGPALAAWATRHSALIGRKWLRRIMRATNKGSLFGGAFYREAIRLHHEKYANNQPVKVVYKDISHNRYGSFNDFIDLCVRAEYIVTTRLHVAIFGALIGKPLSLQEHPGEYNKIKSIHEHSLRHFPNTELLAGIEEDRLRQIAWEARVREDILSKRT